MWSRILVTLVWTQCFRPVSARQFASLLSTCMPRAAVAQVHENNQLILQDSGNGEPRYEPEEVSRNPHPNEVDELSRKRGGKIRRRSDGGRRQQPVHAQSHVDAQVTGPHMAWSSLLQPRLARPEAGAARGGVEGRRPVVAAAHFSPLSTGSPGR